MNMKYMRRGEVEAIVGLSRSTIYSMILQNRFPKPTKIGKRAVAWVQMEIQEWMKDPSLWECEQRGAAQ